MEVEWSRKVAVRITGCVPGLDVCMYGKVAQVIVLFESGDKTETMDEKWPKYSIWCMRNQFMAHF